MLWLPASKLMMPSPIEVFPWPFKGELLMTAIGGLNWGFAEGNGPKVSVKLTLPVGIPYPEFPATSARRNTRVPKGMGLVTTWPDGLVACKLRVVVLGSELTVTLTLLESLGA